MTLEAFRILGGCNVQGATGVFSGRSRWVARVSGLDLAIGLTSRFGVSTSILKVVERGHKGEGPHLAGEEEPRKDRGR